MNEKIPLCGGVAGRSLTGWSLLSWRTSFMSLVENAELIRFDRWTSD